MSTVNEPFYLVIGSTLTESVKSRLTTSGRPHVWKHLRSRPENWHSIADHLASEHLIGAITKFTGRDYERMLWQGYATATQDLLASLGAAKHLVLVHEAVAGSPPASPEEEGAHADWWDDSEWGDREAREYFGDMDPEVQTQVHALFKDHNVTVTTYKRNAEAAIIASSFIDDLQDNLLFRIYVPAGRMYEEELAQLLSIFHHWLGAVKGARVRQGGYRTSAGRIIEFFGDGTTTPSDVTQDFADFKAFLGLLDDRQAARDMLLALGVGSARADELIGRYSRDARRVMLDARHERDRRLLSIQQQLELELSEEDLGCSADDLSTLVESLVPASPFGVPMGLGTGGELRPATSSVVVNNQFISHVEGVVAQNVTGDIQYGTPLDDLLEIIRMTGVPNDRELEVAARQVADREAPASTRITARQQLKSFLLRNGHRAEEGVFRLIWDWLEGQVGI